MTVLEFGNVGTGVAVMSVSPFDIHVVAVQTSASADYITNQAIERLRCRTQNLLIQGHTYMHFIHLIMT